jgi:hypothetical protein
MTTINWHPTHIDGNLYYSAKYNGVTLVVTSKTDIDTSGWFIWVDNREHFLRYFEDAVRYLFNSVFPEGDHSDIEHLTVDNTHAPFTQVPPTDKEADEEKTGDNLSEFHFDGPGFEISVRFDDNHWGDCSTVLRTIASVIERKGRDK